MKKKHIPSLRFDLSEVDPQLVGLRLHLESPMSLKEIYGEGVFSVFPHRNRRGLQTLSRTGLRAWIQMVFWWANLWESGWMRICWTKSADFAYMFLVVSRYQKEAPKSMIMICEVVMARLFGVFVSNCTT